MDTTRKILQQSPTHLILQNKSIKKSSYTMFSHLTAVHGYERETLEDSFTNLCLPSATDLPN